MEIVDSSGVSVMNRFHQIPLERGIIVDGAIADLSKLVESIKTLLRTAAVKAKGSSRPFPACGDCEESDLSHHGGPRAAGVDT
jgi:hypothetical protein